MPDRIREHRWIAPAILAVGAFAYGILCLPLIGQRGYPPLDPVWDGVGWLWIGPVPLSALFAHPGRPPRRRHLLAYSLVTGLIASATTVGMIPKRLDPFEMLIQTPFFAGFIFLGAWLTDEAFRPIARRIRVFIPEENCQKCGYFLRHLTEARCPECGVKFDVRLLNESFEPMKLYTGPVRTTTAACLILVACAAFPFVYQRVSIEVSEREGVAAADEDWAANQVIRYYFRGDASAVLEGSIDPLTGLRTRRVMKGLLEETYARSYNARIDARIARGERLQRTSNFLTVAELRAVSEDRSLCEIREFPFRRGPVTISQRDGGTVVEGFESRSFSGMTVSPQRRVFHTVLTSKGELEIVAIDDTVIVFSPTGEWFQTVDRSRLDLIDRPENK